MLKDYFNKINELVVQNKRVRRKISRLVAKMFRKTLKIDFENFDILPTNAQKLYHLKHSLQIFVCGGPNEHLGRFDKWRFGG